MFYYMVTVYFSHIISQSMKLGLFDAFLSETKKFDRKKRSVPQIEILFLRKFSHYFLVSR